MIVSFMYNKLMEERFIESSKIRQLVEEAKFEIQQLKSEEESFNYFEEEINLLNGHTIQEVVAETSEIATSLDMKPVTRKELEQLIECEIAEHSIEMESESSKRLQLIGAAAIKVIGDEEEYTRLRHRHFERHHYIIRDGEIKMLIGGRCIFGDRCPFTNSDGECTKYCARLDSTRKDIKYLMRYLKNK
jgi:superfamily II DNA helicase RecQ